MCSLDQRTRFQNNTLWQKVTEHSNIHYMKGNSILYSFKIKKKKYMAILNFTVDLLKAKLMSLTH